MVNRRNPVIQAVGYVHHLVVLAERYARRNNHQGCRLGSLGESGTDHGNRFHRGRAASNRQCNSDHGAFVHDRATSRHRPIEYTRDEQCGFTVMVPFSPRSAFSPVPSHTLMSHEPLICGSVMVSTAFPLRSRAIKHPARAVSATAVRSWQTAYNHPAAAHRTCHLACPGRSPHQR